MKTIKRANYSKLVKVMAQAYKQAVSGKGKERHACGEPFERQKICQIGRWLRGNPAAGPLQQAIKKCMESTRLDKKEAIEELYGAINYIAAAVILFSENDST